MSQSAFWFFPGSDPPRRLKAFTQGLRRPPTSLPSFPWSGRGLGGPCPLWSARCRRAASATGPVSPGRRRR
eukprot:923479-Pyramimonas_sp.AAC.1